MSDVKSKLIKVAYNNESLRPEILSVLRENFPEYMKKKASRTKTSDLDAKLRYEKGYIGDHWNKADYGYVQKKVRVSIPEEGGDYEKVIENIEEAADLCEEELDEIVDNSVSALKGAGWKEASSQPDPSEKAYTIRREDDPQIGVASAGTGMGSMVMSQKAWITNIPLQKAGAGYSQYGDGQSGIAGKKAFLTNVAKGDLPDVPEGNHYEMIAKELPDLLGRFRSPSLDKDRGPKEQSDGSFFYEAEMSKTQQGEPLNAEVEIRIDEDGRVEIEVDHDRPDQHRKGEPYASVDYTMPQHYENLKRKEDKYKDKVVEKLEYAMKLTGISRISV